MLKKQKYKRQTRAWKKFQNLKHIMPKFFPESRILHHVNPGKILGYKVTICVKLVSVQHACCCTSVVIDGNSYEAYFATNVA